MEIRKYMPRIGARKLYHILELDMGLMDINIGRDKFYRILKHLKLLVAKRKKLHEQLILITFLINAKT